MEQNNFPSFLTKDFDLKIFLKSVFTTTRRFEFGTRSGFKIL